MLLGFRAEMARCCTSREEESARKGWAALLLLLGCAPLHSIGPPREEAAGALGRLNEKGIGQRMKEI
jgi:hypothetical protein